MEVNISGDYLYERITIKQGNEILHDGLIDDLVTSVSGELELRLNYGFKDKVYSVVLKKNINGDILFIPKDIDCFSTSYLYKFICITQEEFDHLWDNMKYTPSEDYKNIPMVKIGDLVLSWSITSGYRGNEANLCEYLRNFESECIATSNGNFTVGQIFNLLKFTNEIVNIIRASNLMKVSIILNNTSNYEWDAIRVKTDNILFLYLNDSYNIQLN